MTYCCPVWSVINKLYWRVDNETFFDQKYRLESLDGEITFERCCCRDDKRAVFALRWRKYADIYRYLFGYK